MELDVDLGAKLLATLGGINSHLAKQTQLFQRLSDAPRNAPFRASAICPTPTASFAFLVGDPQIGRATFLRQLAVGGSLWTTAAAGQAVIVRSGQNPTLGGAIDTTSVVAYAGSLPNIAQWGNQELFVGPQDNLWCVILNGTAGQQYVASAQYEDFQQGGYAAVVQL